MNFIIKDAYIIPDFFCYVILNMNNIYKVTHEQQINDILEKNQDKLTIIVFSVEDNNILNINTDRNIKKTLKTLSQKYAEHIFVYVDLKKYMLKDEIYTQIVNKDNIPFTYFYYKKKGLCTIQKSNSESITETLNKIIIDILPKLMSEKKQEPEIKNPVEKLLEATSEINTREKLEQIEKVKQDRYVEELQKYKLLLKENEKNV